MTKHERQQHVRIDYKGFVFEEELRFDLLVDGVLLLELKAVQEVLPIHKAQLLSYMKLLDTPLELHEQAIQDALWENTGDKVTKKDAVSLVLGDWGRWNFLRFYALYFLLVIFCLPLFGGRSLIAWGNILCFPFWLNDRLNKK